MVADLHRGYARAHLAHDSSAFMAKDRREDALRILALQRVGVGMAGAGRHDLDQHFAGTRARSEEHTSELQSLMRISYAVFCLKKQKKHTNPRVYTTVKDKT